MNDYLREFFDALQTATLAVDHTYFDIAVAGSAEPIVRERAYCYELFHQLRLALPDDFPFILHGEIDKRGHPEYGECLEGRNPDFVLHMPGSLGRASNLAVIEVKHCGRRSDPPTKDADTLRRFLECVDYSVGILLIYGGTEEQLREHMRRVLADSEDLAGWLRVFWHQSSDFADWIDWVSLL